MSLPGLVHQPRPAKGKRYGMANVGNPVRDKQSWLAGLAQAVPGACDDSRSDADSDDGGEKKVDQEINGKPVGIDAGGQ